MADPNLLNDDQLLRMNMPQTSPAPGGGGGTLFSDDDLLRMASPAEPAPTQQPAAPASPPIDLSAEKPVAEKAVSTPVQADAAGGTARRGGYSNFMAGLNDTIASIAGAPADMAAKYLYGNVIWERMPEPQRAEFREKYPKIASVYDWMLKARQQDPVGGTEWWKRRMGDLPFGGANPDDTVAVTPGEKIMRSAGEAAGSMAIPGLGAEAVLARSWGKTEKMLDGLQGILASRGAPGLAETATRGVAGTGFRSNVAIGAAEGAAGEVAAQAAPDEFKDLARLVAGLGGGVAASMVTGAAERGVRGATTSVRNMLEPAEVTAAKRIQGEAVDPTTLRAGLSETDVDVPGSVPTTFQRTGDEGLGAFERKVAAGSNDATARFRQRYAEQNEARVAAIAKLADPDADASAVGDYVKRRLAEIRQSTDEAVSLAEQRLRGSVDEAGGRMDNRAEYGEAIRSRLATLHQEEKDAASMLWRAIDPDLSVEVNASPFKRPVERLRSTIPATARPPEGEEKAIYDLFRGMGATVNFGDMVALRSRITDAIRDNRVGGNTQSLRRLGRVLAIVDDGLAARAAAVEPARKDTLLSELKAEADAWMTTQARRLSDDPQAATGTIGTGQAISPSDAELGFIGPGTIRATPGAEGAAGGPPGLAAGGPRVPEAGPAQRRIEDQFVEQAKERNLGTTLTREQAHAAPVVYAGVKQGTDADGFIFVTRSQRRAEQMAGVDGEVREFRLRPGSTVYPDMARTPSFGNTDGRTSLLRGKRDDSMGLVNTSELEPVGSPRGVTGEVAERYAAARGATAEMKSRFESGPVGRVLRPAGERGTYRMTTSDVANNVFDSPEKLGAYVRAATRGEGGAPDVEAMSLLEDFAAFSMRRAAVRDGMVSPAKLEDWRQKHQYALNQFPELAAKFANVRDAQRALDTAMGNQKQALADYQTKAVSRFLDDRDPVEAMRSAMRSPESFARLADDVKAQDPAALAGMRRAALETVFGRQVAAHIHGENLPGTEAVTSNVPELIYNTMKNAYAANRDALSKLFSPDEMRSIERVIMDAQVGNRSASAMRFPGSNTAQDTSGRGQSFFQNMLMRYGGRAVGAAAGAGAGYMHGGTTGAIIAGAGMAAGHVMDTLNAARMARVDRAIVEMMLDPLMAKVWLDKIPQVNTGQAAGDNFARRVRAVVASQVASQMEDGTAERVKRIEVPERSPAVAERPNQGSGLSIGPDVDLGPTTVRDAGVRPPGNFPGQEDVDLARSVDAAYGSENARFFESGDAEMRQIATRLAPMVVNDERYSDVPWEKVDKAVANKLYMASLAANRSAVASLGFDPRSFVVSPPDGTELTAGGAYSAKSDAAWINSKNPSTFVHESIHRGIEMMRREGLLAKSYEDGSGKPYVSPREEEMVTRALMIKMFGDVEKGRGPLGDQQVERAKKYMSEKRITDLMDKLEEAAARAVQQRRNRGPR